MVGYTTVAVSFSHEQVGRTLVRKRNSRVIEMGEAEIIFREHDIHIYVFGLYK